MLKYERIDIWEGIDINKTNASKECDTCHYCHYWYFSGKNLKYEPYLCNGCHDLLQETINFNNVAIASVTGSDYRIYFWYMSKNDAINIMKSSNLNEKGRSLYFFIIYIYVILNRAKDYYKNDKERLRDNAKDKYRNLSEEEKNKKRKYERNWYDNMSEEKKQKLKECQKISWS